MTDFAPKRPLEMPTVLRTRGFQFFFYAQDENEPPHIHVAKAGCDAKFWLEPVQLAVNRGFRPHDLREIVKSLKRTKR